jgi:unsaturated rhamnogalacturonyl hydrolase
MTVFHDLWKSRRHLSKIAVDSSRSGGQPGSGLPKLMRPIGGGVTLSGNQKRAFRDLLVVMMIVCLPFVSHAQEPDEKPASEFLPAVGDAPATAPPLAIDLSPTLERAAVEKAMLKVANWQLGRVRNDFNRDWTFAALYNGFMAASAASGDKKYSDAMLGMGRKFKWQPGDEYKDANDLAVGRTYLELYFQHHDPQMIGPLRAEMDRLMRAPATDKLVWYWCDALFMAPPAFAEMYKATGDASYLRYMKQQWRATSAKLYDPEEHLFSRDERFLDKHQANGKKIFWSRGNGWVIAGLVGVLTYMPANDPDRPWFEQQFREMSKKLADIQGADGLWRTGLLDPESYALPEVSGSAFNAYALAWGINHKLLDAATYQPNLVKAWTGLLSHIYADGRLGCIQSVADSPGKFQPTSSYVYGVGAFLLAASEVDALAKGLRQSGQSK